MQGFLAAEASATTFAQIDSLALTYRAVEANADERSIQVFLEIFWRGEPVSESDASALRRTTRLIGAAPAHFVSPSYFLGKDASQQRIMNFIGSNLNGHNVVGTYISPRRSLLAMAQIPMRSESQMQNANPHCFTDCGDSIPLDIYTPEEIRLLVLRSLNVMRESGVSTINVARSNQTEPSSLVTDIFADFELNLTTQWRLANKDTLFIELEDETSDHSQLRNSYKQKLTQDISKIIMRIDASGHAEREKDIQKKFTVLRKVAAELSASIDPVIYKKISAKSRDHGLTLSTP